MSKPGGKQPVKRWGLVLVGACCLIAVLVVLLWDEPVPDPAIEACQSCDIRHQRLKPKDSAAE